ncbi:MAG: aminoacyl-tRNA hydrolase [Firmicutes bacterium]|nr:aminoacyl-tRNA hydrolase [Bacillota bacterium]
MKVIIGLGNPGPTYAHNRHNVGYMLLGRLAESLKIDNWFYRYHARISEISVDGTDIVFVQPQTYMNNSGRSARAVLAAYHLDPDDMLVVYDDLDLAVGQLRLRRKGSAGGHKGVLSVINALGVEEFHRLRLGIGRPPLGVEVVDHVLQDFTPKELKIIDEVLDTAVSAAEIWIREGIESAMAKFNGISLSDNSSDA